MGSGSGTVRETIHHEGGASTPAPDLAPCPAMSRLRVIESVRGNDGVWTLPRPIVDGTAARFPEVEFRSPHGRAEAERELPEADVVLGWAVRQENCSRRSSRGCSASPSSPPLVFTGILPPTSMLPSAMKSVASPGPQNPNASSWRNTIGREVLVDHRHVDVVGREAGRLVELPPEARAPPGSRRGRRGSSRTSRRRRAGGACAGGGDAHRGRAAGRGARSMLVTTSATPPSLSWQQSSLRRIGSTIQRDCLVLLERERAGRRTASRVGRRVLAGHDRVAAEVHVGDAVRVHVALVPERVHLGRRVEAEREVPVPARRRRPRDLVVLARCGWPKRRPDRSLNARYTTTASAAPDATAADASCTVAHAPPPPPRVRAVKRSSGMPEQRMSASSSFMSMANVTAPSMSVGVRPASATAASDRLARELELAAAGVLGELGLADADDRGLVGVVAASRQPPAATVTGPELREHERLVDRSRTSRSTARPPCRCATSSASTPSRFDTKRMPSSSSTSTTTRGSASGSVGWCDTIHV